MSDSPYSVSNSGSYLTIKMPSYRCPKHGLVEGEGTVQLWSKSGEPEGEFCMVCYKEWIRANIPAVTREPSSAAPNEDSKEKP